MDKLVTMDGEQLMTAPLPPLRFIATGFLPQGLSLFAGAPKIGKSWLALWLCLQVAKGEPLWNYPVERGAVLYLCLEDSFTRIQNRLFDLTDDAPNNLFFATMSATLGDGLEQQIEKFCVEHPETSLVVVDTLQRIRGASSDANPYANDYRDVVQLKQLADRHGLAILLIHHLRKMNDDDPINMISGTTGISGGADASYVLKRDSRNVNTAVLYCTGRDIEYRELRMEFDKFTHRWNQLSDSVDAAPEPRDAVLSLLCNFVGMYGAFTGTATELSAALEQHCGEKLQPNVLMKKIVRHQQELMNCGVVFTAKRTHERRELTLANTRVDCVGNDGKFAGGSVSDLPSQPLQPTQG
ncbi:AAA family ATPase [Harryflintia acetispora]|uniref:AAA family ATPase n=1 Tax=Harryflintia acetispora TaxID=1849041 RepID=UPI00189C25B5|nr:AAA family ATPase [Harryflintia acetispora]